jgi:hypothetical protein
LIPKLQKGQSGKPGGRPKGSRTFAIRELVAEALADPSTREAAIQEFRRALSRTRTVIPSLEFGARVNKEIGQGSGEWRPGRRHHRFHVQP